jgi:hypothetical protein
MGGAAFSRTPSTTGNLDHRSSFILSQLSYVHLGQRFTASRVYLDTYSPSPSPLHPHTAKLRTPTEDWRLLAVTHRHLSDRAPLFRFPGGSTITIIPSSQPSQTRRRYDGRYHDPSKILQSSEKGVSSPRCGQNRQQNRCRAQASTEVRWLLVCPIDQDTQCGHQAI